MFGTGEWRSQPKLAIMDELTVASPRASAVLCTAPENVSSVVGSDRRRWCPSSSLALNLIRLFDASDGAKLAGERSREGEGEVLAL